MGITAQLVEVTPYRLRYLMTTTTTSIGFNQATIPNAFGPTPDLRTDAFTFDSSPMMQLVSLPVIVGDVINAQRQLIGEGRITNLDVEAPRAHVYVWPRDSAGFIAPWAVFPSEGSVGGSVPSTGFAVLVVTGPAAAGHVAYIDLDYEHTVHR